MKMPSEQELKKLYSLADKLRMHVIESVTNAQSGHVGGSLSSADMVTALYFHIMHHDPKNPQWEDRDRFVLSKGHSCPVLYAALAEAGYFPVKELMTFRKYKGLCQGHPSVVDTPGIEMSTGSLGQGLSVAVGMALATRLDRRNVRVFVLLGDGELDAGMAWEAAMSAAHFKLDNLTAILDYNRLQSDGWCEHIMGLEPLEDKWRAYNWHVIRINGHDIPAFCKAVDEASRTRGRPTLILADTIKGKGVSFLEGADRHGKATTEEERDKALAELRMKHDE